MNPGSEERIALLPEQAQAEYREYVRSGDDKALSGLIGHIFRFHEVGDFDENYAQKGDDLVILQDLNVDSLTLAEIIFYAEDLLNVRISDEEVQQINTLGDLKKFISQKRVAE